jgi:hypothetical protein
VSNERWAPTWARCETAVGGRGEPVPVIAEWVRGHVEIGDQEGFVFVVRALEYGGLVFEDDKSDMLAEALAALEKGPAEYFEREGIG